MLGKGFETRRLHFANGVEKVMLEHLKVLQVRGMVSWDWNRLLDIRLNVGDLPMEIFSQARWGRRVGYIVHVVMESPKVRYIVHVAVES